MFAWITSGGATGWPVSIDKDNIASVGGSGKKKDIEAHVAQIKAQIEETTSDCDKEKLRERPAKLAGGVAAIKVGGASGIEVKGKKDRVDDALNANRAAVEEGIVSWAAFFDGSNVPATA